LNQAIRNAGDGISLAQTAEGALGSMTDNLQRIRELAVQSANATNSDDDRAALQQEVDALVAEITRTGEETNFNGRNLFDGQFQGTFQIGANAGQTVDVNIQELTASKLGVGDATGVSAIGTDEAIQNGDLSINGVAIDPSRANSDTASVVDAGASAIAKVAAINEQSDATGVTAQVNTTVASGVEMTAAQTAGTISVNDVDISISTGGVNLASDREAVIFSINAKSEQTGVTATSGGDSGGVILEAADGRNITVEFKGFGADSGDDSMISAATGLQGGTDSSDVVGGSDDRATSYGGFTLVSDNGSDINLQGGSGTGTGDIANAGLTAGVFSRD
jgi:flagellin